MLKVDGLGVSSPGAAYDRLTPLIGACGPPVSGIVTIRDIERFAAATGDRIVARDRPDGRIAAPPLMLSSVIEWGAGPGLAALRDDGTGVGREGWLPLAGLKLMGGGQDLTFHADVLSGDAFTATPRLDDVQLKSAASGPLLLLTVTTVFRDAAGRELVTCHETLIAR